MTTPETRNQVEKLDNLLNKVDAVRFALPEIVDFFTTSSGSAAQQHAQTTVLEYREKVKQAERSLTELQNGAVSLADTLLKLQAQADSLNISKKISAARLRKNPYSSRFQSTTVFQKSLQKNLQYPQSSEDDIAAASPESLNAVLDQHLARSTGLQLASGCEKWDKGRFAIKLSGLATFHVFISWGKTGRPVFLRLNILGEKEARQPFQLSEYTLWVHASVQASQAMLRHSDQNGLNIPCLLSLIRSYADVYDSRCSNCARLLHPQSSLLPLARLYQSGGAEKASDSWQAYHSECWPNTAHGETAA